MSSFFASLDDRATLTLDGPDARPFLQGQTTCDVEGLAADSSLAGAFCTPQGRVICDFRLLQRSPENLILTLPADVADAALAAFGKYIIFSKATIGDASAAWRQFAVWGPDALGRIGAPATHPGCCWSAEEVLWSITDTDTAEACAPAEAAERLARRLGVDLEQADSAAYRCHEIERGIGHVRGPTVEKFLPQMLNYQLTGRVSFTKGCYTGQEVVARMHYRGKVKRAMLLASAANDGSAAVRPGDPLFEPGGDQAVGHVVDAAPAGDGRLKLLVIVALDARRKPLTLGEAGATLSFVPLPYPVETGDPG